MLFGKSLYVDRHLCQVSFVRWQRTHRKARIRKKWRKKYGAVWSKCPGKAFSVGGSFVVCPCVYAAMAVSGN